MSEHIIGSGGAQTELLRDGSVEVTKLHACQLAGYDCRRGSVAQHLQTPEVSNVVLSGTILTILQSPYDLPWESLHPDLLGGGTVEACLSSSTDRTFYEVVLNASAVLLLDTEVQWLLGMCFPVRCEPRHIEEHIGWYLDGLLGRGRLPTGVAKQWASVPWRRRHWWGYAAVKGAFQNTGPGWHGQITFLWPMQSQWCTPTCWPEMVRAAEKVATAGGTDFLRVDLLIRGDCDAVFVSEVELFPGSDLVEPTRTAGARIAHLWRWFYGATPS